MKEFLKKADLYSMSNILFVTDNYYPDISATGSCIDNVASYFLSKGWSVSILASQHNKQWKTEEWKDGKKIYRIPTGPLTYGSNNRIYRLISHCYLFANNILHYGVWPIKSVRFCKSLADKIIELNDIENYKHIVFSINPPYSLLVNSLLKSNQKGKELHTIAYYLDMLRGECHIKYLPRSFSDNKIYKFEKKYLGLFDFVVFTDSHYNIYGQAEYNYINNKRFIKLPAINFNLLDLANQSDNLANKYIHIVYVGLIGKDNRNPDKLLSFFDSYANLYRKKIVIDFYGKTEGYNFRTVKNEWFECYHHGVVPKTDAINYSKKADVLLNIDNVNQDMLPSKIFEYISMRKPIINISNHSKPSLDNYLNLYPGYISVIPQIDKSSFDKLHAFFNEKLYLDIDKELIVDLYKDYSPEAFYSIVEGYE